MQYLTLTNILIVLAILLVLYIISVYNRLIVSKNRISEALSSIEIMMKNRFDLIPNLINTVKGAANFETSTLEKVLQARNSAINVMSGHNTKAIEESDNMMSGALKSLFALSENYPDLKASNNYLSLQNELSDIENKIMSARRFYNATVLDYNNSLQKFPSNIFASMFGFVKQEMFEVSQADKEAVNKPVEVKF